MMRFERAVRVGNPNLVLAAAHELPKPVRLRDALRIVLVLAVGAPDQFPAAAARFGARLVSERRLPLEEAQLVFAALGTLAGVQRAAGGGRRGAVLGARASRRDGGRPLPGAVAGYAAAVTPAVPGRDRAYERSGLTCSSPANTPSSSMFTLACHPRFWSASIRCWACS
jgi:hypothetical protein